MVTISLSDNLILYLCAVPTSHTPPATHCTSLTVLSVECLCALGHSVAYTFNSFIHTRLWEDTHISFIDLSLERILVSSAVSLERIITWLLWLAELHGPLITMFCLYIVNKQSFQQLHHHRVKSCLHSPCPNTVIFPDHTFICGVLFPRHKVTHRKQVMTVRCSQPDVKYIPVIKLKACSFDVLIKYSFHLVSWGNRYT